MHRNWPRVDEGYFELLRCADTLDYQLPSEQSQNEILKLMVKTFQAESGQFCIHDSHHAIAKKEKTALVNLSWRYTDQYIEHFHNIDPFIHIMPDIGAFRNQDLMPPATWRSCEFNEDFIKPQKIQNLLVIRLLDSERLVGHIGLFRHQSSPAFSQKDLYKAQHLASVFSQKIKHKQMVQKSKELELLLQQLRDVPSAGVTILNSELYPVYTNLKMMEFESPSTAALNYGYGADHCAMLSEEVMTECREMARSFRESAQPLLQNRHVVLFRSQRQRVDVEILILPAQPPSGEHFKHFYLLLVFTRANASAASNYSKTIFDFRLTPKEREITTYLCQGLSNKEISQKLFISLPTVATHVQHILRKTGISRRSQLISHLLC